MFGLLKKLFGTSQERTIKKYFKQVLLVNKFEEEYQKLSEEELKAKTKEFQQRLREGALLDDLLPEAYATVKNCCRRLVGTEFHVFGYNQRWDMIPYDVQVVGAIAMHAGSIAEMQTGEGKTLTATMPLYLNALTGKSVHLVTINDYLAERDCLWMGSIFRYLGLTCGALTGGMHSHQRKEIYACDIVYGTASDFGFDYLRDNSIAISHSQQVQRGHYFAIVDEVDSILIDEARTPLIISGPTAESHQMYDQLQDAAAELVTLQRDYCNKIASEAKKLLDAGSRKEGTRKLWLVSKGLPNNKLIKRAKEDPDLRLAIDNTDTYFYNDQNKDEKNKLLSDLYVTIDEKSNEFELTDKGIEAWAKTKAGHANDFMMLDLGHEYAQIEHNPSLETAEKMQAKLSISEEDRLRKERSHNLRQLMRAHLLMEKDVDYIIQEGKIVIIDENTGRAQAGRRFSDGLHQAIEAKENLEIQGETQTYATITLQNYFRLYTKIAGMTGTAITEAHEFKEIYKLQVLQIPTHNPCKRVDANDEVYMTEREKYAAILKEVMEVHKMQRPILIGTESVEVSEKLSRIFRQAGLAHTILNAKHHDKEAAIVADAGCLSAITISTNMAGRGTDIKLKQDVAQKGGLHVIGTTRHQSRRIDRQLRGRCARLGDPGSSKFYVSFEDHLMRLFSSPGLTGMLKRFRPPEGEAISAGILNKSIETAQKRIEQRNYTIRKHTLEYDDVMNMQRQAIYSLRGEILHATDLNSLLNEIFAAVCLEGSHRFLRNKSEDMGWDLEGLKKWLRENFPLLFDDAFLEDDLLLVEEIAGMLTAKIMLAFEEKLENDMTKINTAIEPARKKIILQGAIRDIMLRRLDQRWQEHLLEMDYLRSEVSLRAVAQKDPLVEFKQESFSLFEKLNQDLKASIAYDLFRFEMRPFDPLMMSMMQKNLQFNQPLIEEPSEEI